MVSAVFLLANSSGFLGGGGVPALHSDLLADVP